MNGNRLVSRWLLAGLLASSPGLLLGARQTPAPRADQNWPQWRGPDGNGVSRAVNLPTTWSPEKNIVWKTPLPSWSGGTPVLWGDHIFVTSPNKPTEAKAGTETGAQDRPTQPPGQKPR